MVIFYPTEMILLKIVSKKFWFFGTKNKFSDFKIHFLGEEELQLQLALAMSREEAEQEETKSKSDDMRLQLALQKSKEEVASGSV